MLARRKIIEERKEHLELQEKEKVCVCVLRTWVVHGGRVLGCMHVVCVPV